MIRVLASNPNTIEYWEKVYTAEAGTAKERVDDVRFGQLMRWVGLRGSELGRRPNLLDAGCGLGDIVQKMKSKNMAGIASYSGMDISPSTIAKCKATLESDQSRFYVGNVLSMPFSDEAYDVTWCGETLEHVDHPDHAMRELARVTGETGLVVISTPYKRRNTSPEHVWEFSPEDISRWSVIVGELLFLDCLLLPEWLTMVAVFRRLFRTISS